MKKKVLHVSHEVKLYNAMIIFISLALIIIGGGVSHGQDDPIGRLLREGLERDNGTLKAPAERTVGTVGIPGVIGTAMSCPEGWECVLAGSVTKKSYKKKSVRIPVDELTHDWGFDRISLRQTIGETHGVIINTVKVGAPGTWTKHPIGIRCPEGRTVLEVPVRRGTRELHLALDHGKGARLRLVLERRLP
jgi:hypothetical protein